MSKSISDELDEMQIVNPNDGNVFKMYPDLKQSILNLIEQRELWARRDERYHNQKHWIKKLRNGRALAPIDYANMMQKENDRLAQLKRTMNDRADH